jgi:hypothetical protein
MGRWKIAIGSMVAGILSGVSVPSAAERVETYWLPTPANDDLQGTVPVGTAFLEQRLIPAKLVRLKEELSLGNKTIAAGTYLYMVFNEANRVGYCTLKDRSMGRQIKTLFLPVLDQRPCFVDSNGDQRFDRTFSVFDKYGGPPSVRGSIDSAQPLATSSTFTVVDAKEFPLDLRMSLIFTGSKKGISKARIALRFNGAVTGNWQEIRGVQTSRGTLYSVANVQLLLISLNEGSAKFEAKISTDLYVSTNNQNTLFWGHLPAL